MTLQFAKTHPDKHGKNSCMIREFKCDHSLIVLSTCELVSTCFYIKLIFQWMYCYNKTNVQNYNGEARLHSFPRWRKWKTGTHFARKESLYEQQTQGEVNNSVILHLSKTLKSLFSFSVFSFQSPTEE